MDNKQFKHVFGEIAQLNNFKKAFSGWFTESDERIFVLELQKSNYGDYYELNIKIFIQGMFSIKYSINKDLVKKYMGNIFTRQPNEYNEFLNLDKEINDDVRIQGVKDLFEKFITLLTKESLSKNDIWNLAQKGEVYLLPAVKEELIKLIG